MGAGAGYTIYVKNSKVSNIDSVEVVDIVRDNYYIGVVVNCRADVIGDVRAESYYYGCDWIKDVPMVLEQVELGIDFGYGYDEDVLTTEAVEKYMAEFNVGDVSDAYSEILKVFTVEDLDVDHIIDRINDSWVDGEGNYGGGYMRNNFSGTFELDDLDSHDGYNEAQGATLTITDKFVIDFIEKAVYGENIDYNIFFDGVNEDGSDNENDAIQSLKNMISEAITDGDIDDIDLSQCYVMAEYYQLMNAEGEIDYVDLDSSEIVYSADTDPDYEDYL